MRIEIKDRRNDRLLAAGEADESGRVAWDLTTFAQPAWREDEFDVPGIEHTEPGFLSDLRAYHARSTATRLVELD